MVTFETTKLKNIGRISVTKTPTFFKVELLLDAKFFVGVVETSYLSCEFLGRIFVRIEAY